MELAGYLAIQRLLAGFHGQEKVGPSTSGGVEKLSLVVERIYLDQNALEIKLAEQGFEHRPVVVLADGVSGLADRHA